MNSLLGKSFALAVGLASALALTPAVAAPAIHPAPGSFPDTNPRVIQVQTPGSPQTGADFYHRGSGAYRYHGRYHQRRHWHNRRHYPRHGGYYYRHHHHRDNGAAVVGGLITGAIIGGIAANAMGNHGGSSHVRWCYNRYRSYRASDNTYQPYHGPRRQCVSPY